MLSIPEKATQLVDNILAQVDEDSSRSIFIVGSKKVGKSTLLHLFLDKNETPRETIVLEYSFARKTSQKQGMDKVICHIWEYGGKFETLKSTLLSIPLNRKLFYCIMVDLSKIKNIWNIIEVCIEALNELHPNSQKMIELILLCGKYDVFKNYDNEIKNFICTILRCLSMLHKAHLIFYSSKEPTLAKKAKEMFNNIGFGSGIPFKEKNTIYTKPLLIPKGSDSWESIGVSPSTLQEVKVRYLSRIIPEPILNEIANTSTQKLVHPETVIDTLQAMKYDELRSIESLDTTFHDYLLSINK